MNKKLTERLDAIEAKAAHAAFHADLFLLKQRQEPKRMDELVEAHNALHKSVHVAYALIEERTRELRELVGGALERIARVEKRPDDKEAKV
jgi:hypothetical protein